MTNGDFDYVESILTDLMASTEANEQGVITASVDFGHANEDSLLEIYAELAALRDRIRGELRPTQYRSRYS